MELGNAVDLMGAVNSQIGHADLIALNDRHAAALWLLIAGIFLAYLVAKIVIEPLNDVILAEGASSAAGLRSTPRAILSKWCDWCSCSR